MYVAGYVILEFYAKGWLCSQQTAEPSALVTYPKSLLSVSRDSSELFVSSPSDSSLLLSLFPSSAVVTFTLIKLLSIIRGFFEICSSASTNHLAPQFLKQVTLNQLVVYFPRYFLQAVISSW